MLVSMELEAMKFPSGWKPRPVTLALCPIRVRRTEDRKQQNQNRSACKLSSVWFQTLRRSDLEGGRTSLLSVPRF